jgi:SAM-dependent methyltransferase
MQDLASLRAFLHSNFRRESADMFGLPDGPWVARAVNNWFDESTNYDRRWNAIRLLRPRVGRILDMAAGCGTFLLHGLLADHDVVGVEPEPWKRQYYARKVIAAAYPRSFRDRMLGAAGESLPFADHSFDLVTTFQTLEHVADVDRCLAEMVRVLRPGGVLYLRAPDYNCFFEPHYRLPFLPTMRRDWAERYLRLRGRPLAGLRSLNWTTERGIIASLRRLPADLRILRTRDFFIERRRQEYERNLQPFWRRAGAARVLNEAHQLKRRAAEWLRCLQQERVIDLWIIKRG